MSPDNQRIIIAEACGIKPPYKFNQGEDGKDWVARKTVWTIPDYLNDLNAMHEAENALSPSQRTAYESILIRVVGLQSKIESKIELSDFDLAHSNAPQRAESLVRAIGKWVES